MFWLWNGADGGFVQVRVVPDLSRGPDYGDVLGEQRVHGLRISVASEIA